MKTFLAVLFGMVLWQLIINILVSRYQDKLAKMKKDMVKFHDKDETTWIDADEFEIKIPEGYDTVVEGDRIMIRKKKEE